MDAPAPRRRWRFLPAVVVAYATFEVLLKSKVLEAAARHVPDAWARGIVVALTLAFWSAIAWALWTVWRRVFRTRGPGRGPADLGHPYEFHVETARGGRRAPVRLVLSPDELKIRPSGPHALVGGFDPPLPDGVPLAALRSVDPRPATIVVAFDGPSGPESLAFAPSSYADRQRFLWELAVLRADLFDASTTATAAP
jgi:hypothetical protein